MSIKIKILPAYKGDAIKLIFNDENCIMIDSGTRRAYSKGKLKNEIQNNGLIDLLILTHTDEDHIGGILKYFEDSTNINCPFNQVWFNTK